MALVNNPRVVFLDEPTAGLDPQVRREIYDIIEELKKEKKTILLTTHYIEEAEKLCDRVAIVDHGKVIALGTPRELKERYAIEFFSIGGGMGIIYKRALESGSGKWWHDLCLPRRC